MIFLKQNRLLGQLAVVDVFVYFDGPRLFLAENGAGQRFLVNSLDSDSLSESWLLVAVSERRFLQLAEGLMDVRTAFVKPELETVYQVVSNSAQELVSSTMLSSSELTDEYLPETGVFLKSPVSDTAPNAAFLAKSLNASVLLLHLFPKQSRREAPLRGVGHVFTSLQNCLELKLRKVFQLPSLENFEVELLGTFAGSLGVEIVVRGDDERIAQALKDTLEDFRLAEEGGLSEHLTNANAEEISAVRKFMSDISSLKSGLEIETASQRDDEPIRVSVALPRLREVVKTLKKTRTNESETRTVVGDLVALNLRTGRFELTAIDTDESITGSLQGPRFSEEQTAELPRRYRVVVERKIARSPSGQDIPETWKLVSATKLL
jgi:hypothetical protein